jgi:hypothetical protein
MMQVYLQSVNNEVNREEVYGMLPYVASFTTWITGYQYTKSAIMNEYLSEEILFLMMNIYLAVEILYVKDLDQKFLKIFAKLIMKCWYVKPENRPTAKELYQY